MKQDLQAGCHHPAQQIPKPCPVPAGICSLLMENSLPVGFWVGCTLSTSVPTRKTQEKAAALLVALQCHFFLLCSRLWSSRSHVWLWNWSGRCPGLLGTLGRAAEPVVQKQLLNSMPK